MTSRKKVILIGIPCFQGVSAETLEDYMRFAYYLGRRYTEYEFCLAIKSKTEQFRARNAIVLEARKIQADYLLFLDDDQVIEVDGILGPSSKYEFLRKMIQLDKDIVGGLYWQRGGTYNPVALYQVDDVKYKLLNADDITNGPQRVDVVGGGCMLIKMGVFEKISEPFFEPEHTYSTDIQLCRKAKHEAGLEIWLDSSISIGHVIKEQNVIHSGNIDQFIADRKKKIDNNFVRENFGNLPPLREHIMNEFRQDVIEYLKIDPEKLVELANSHEKHQKKFYDYEDKEKYYREAGLSYLARACFIHQNEATKPIDEFILKNFNTNKGIGLDFGCGAAPITFELCKRGYKVNFIDIDGSPNFEFLKWRAKKYGLYNKTAFFPQTIPHGLDFVLCLDSIEHLENWREVITEIADSLVEGGILITNFIILGDRDNQEHIFMDKIAFLTFAAENGLWQTTNVVFQKRKELNLTNVKEYSK